MLDADVLISVNQHLRTYQKRVERLGIDVYAGQVTAVSRRLPKYKRINDEDSRLASAHLRTCVDLLEQDARRQAAKITAAQWLFMLRAAPLSLFDGGADQQVEVRSIIEHLTCRHGKVGDSGSIYLWSDRDVIRLIRLLATGTVLFLYRQAVGAVNRGGRLIRTGGSDAPEVHESQEVAETNNLFVERASAEGDAELAIIGTPLTASQQDLEEIDLDAEGADEDACITIRQMTSFRMLPDYAALAMQQPQRGRVIGQYYHQSTSVHGLLAGGPTLLPGAATDSQRRSITCLLLLLRYLTWSFSDHPGPWITGVYQLGVMGVPVGSIERFIDSAWSASEYYLTALDPEATRPTSTEFVATLEALTSIGGMPKWGSPVIRDGADHYLFDMAAAYCKWPYLLGEAVASSGADPKGGHFNKEVQNVIDASAWCPGPEARRLIGPRTLKDGSETDVDAVGEKDGHLLLIEAKSFPRTGAYDSGAYNAIHGRAETLATELDKHEERRSRLLTVGSRVVYISRWQEIIVAICVPGALWLPLGPLTEYSAPGLRKVSTLGELRVALA